MTKKMIACCTTLMLAAAAASFAADAAPKGKPELKEKTGAIEIVKADAKKHEKYDTVLLKVGEETIKLLPGKDKKAFKKLEGLGGKNVTVKGAFLPPNPPKYPLAAIKVDAFEEVKAPAAPAKK